MNRFWCSLNTVIHSDKVILKRLRLYMISEGVMLWKWPSNVDDGAGSSESRVRWGSSNVYALGEELTLTSSSWLRPHKLPESNHQNVFCHLYNKNTTAVHSCWVV